MCYKPTFYFPKLSVLKGLKGHLEFGVYIVLCPASNECPVCVFHLHLTNFFQLTIRMFKKFLFKSNKRNLLCYVSVIFLIVPQLQQSMKKDREGEEKGKRRGFPSILGPPRRPSRHDNSASTLKFKMLRSHHSMPSLHLGSFSQNGLLEKGVLEMFPLNFRCFYSM